MKRGLLGSGMPQCRFLQPLYKQAYGRDAKSPIKHLVVPLPSPIGFEINGSSMGA